VEKYIKKNIYSGNPERIKLMKAYYQKEPSRKDIDERKLRKAYGGAWEFNESIGYIRLYFFGTQIRGEYWGVNSKRIVRTRKKTFEFKTRKLATEINILSDSDSNSIFNKILEYLSRCQKELKCRYIDSSHLKTIGPYVNWKSFYDDFKNL